MDQLQTMPTKRAWALLATVSAIFMTAPALAGTTEWALNEGGRMRLTAFPPEADGTVHALLEVEPKAGWITYWREPGASGIPPQVTPSGGARLVSMDYAVPKPLKLGDLTDIGYDAPVAFPLVLEGTRGDVKLDAFIGICNDICIPFQASFSLKLDEAGADPAEAARMEAARRTLPGSPDAGFAVVNASQAADALTLELTVPEPALPTEAILTGPEGYVFTAEGNGPDVVIPLRDLPADRGESINWRVLLKNGGRAIETPISLK